MGALRRMALLLVRENERLVAKMLELQRRLLKAEGKDAEQLRLELFKLEEELSKNRERILQPPSEKRASKAEGGDEPKPTQTGHGPRAQPELEVREVIHDLDEADKQCPSCGGQLQAWEGQFEESDEVDLIERRFVINRHKRRKYRCDCGGCVETAEGPRRVLSGGRYSAAFTIAVVVGKYLDHLPLERQVRQMARCGLVVDSQVLFDQCWALCELLRPAYVRLGQTQRAQPLLYADETRWPVHSTKAQELAAASKWHLWTLVSELGVYYEIHGGRDAKTAESLLANFAGYVMCDGYAAYDALSKKYPSLRLLQCWVHVRRNFIDCESAFPVECKKVLDLIGELYAIEARAGDDLKERLRLRQSESRAVLARIQQWVFDVRCLPGSALFEAITYMTNRWSRLTCFVEDPRLPLDNNVAERALRGPVVGRKNHYGSRSLRGVEVAALFYSLLESAKLVGMNPEAYLARAIEAALAGETIPLPHEMRLSA